MSRPPSDIQSFISKELHSLLFLEEFVFSRNKFSPPSSSELELADAVVMLGDVLLIYQIKERSPQHMGDAVSERRWFKWRCLAKLQNRFATHYAILKPTLKYAFRMSVVAFSISRGVHSPIS